MGRFSKLWGALIGSALGLAGGMGLPTDWATPEVQGLIVTVLSVAGTFVAPPNDG